MKNNLNLSKIQKDVLLGTLLGDASLQTYTNHRSTFRVRYLQSEDLYEYIMHLGEIWKDWVLTPPKRSEYLDNRTNKVYSKYWFNTITHSEFKAYGDMFYKKDNNSHKYIKTIPEENKLFELLTPRAIAYWFMDDGAKASKNVTAKKLCTDSFTHEEVYMLIKILKLKYNLICSPIKDDKNLRIYISTKSYEEFKNLISPYIIPTMEYKLY